MAFTVRESIVRTGDQLFYDVSFRNHIESHLNVLKTVNSQTVLVPPEAVYQFEGNLFGYLASTGHDTEHHWIIMRINGYHNPHEFGRETPERAKPIEGIQLRIPDLDLISRIRTLYLNKK